MAEEQILGKVAFGPAPQWSGPQDLSGALTVRGQEIEARMNKALDDLARSIGRSAVDHLKEMYPDALASVTKNAEVSLTNHVRNEINFHIRPLLAIIRSLAP